MHSPFYAPTHPTTYNCLFSNSDDPSYLPQPVHSYQDEEQENASEENNILIVKLGKNQEINAKCVAKKGSLICFHIACPGMLWGLCL
jgi:hypothetical protein